MTDNTANTAAQAEQTFDALQAQAEQAQAERADALKTHAPAPEGYQIRWPKPGYDLLKRLPEAPEGSPCLAGAVQCPPGHHPSGGHQGR